ncbi:hypothetical protein MPER_07633 [Moniliophthora perniciosa FA553]|nr:hypothetical protein MPER_07633 [Moniliophthora perniciosa FA553]
MHRQKTPPVFRITNASDVTEILQRGKEWKDAWGAGIALVIRVADSSADDAQDPRPFALKLSSRKTLPPYASANPLSDSLNAFKVLPKSSVRPFDIKSGTE